MFRSTLILALCATWSSTLSAQDLTHKAKPQAGPIAISNATIHVVTGDPIENGLVVFDKGKIVFVGSARGQLPNGAKVIDGTGMHVYPGLISSYTHLGLTEIGAVRASRDMDEAGAVTPEVRAAVAVNPDSTLLPVTRSNGILTFATFPRGGTIPGRASLMRMDGWTWEDMAVRADAGLVVRWPNARPPRRRGRRAPTASPYEESVQRIRDSFARARAYVRWTQNTKTPKSTDLAWEAFRNTLSRARPVFFLANTYQQITEVVAFARKERIRAVIVGGHDADLCAPLLVANNVGVIIENIHRFPKRSDSPVDEVYRLPSRLEKAGVLWCLASGDRTANERNLPFAAARAVAYGLAPAAALRSITINAAKVFGVDSELGSIETGKRATLIVTDGDPLQIPTHVKMAFIDGRSIDLTNKQTALFEKYKAKYRRK